MAVKKHKLVAENHKHLDLIALAKYFQLLNEQSNYLPQSQELVKHCQDILKCLSRTVGTEEQLWQLLQPVEEFLLRIVTSVHCNIRHQILIAILDKFYTYISDPQLEVYPTTAAVLVVIEGSDEETILSAARWIVKQRKDEPNGTGHAMALSRLYYWLYEWHGTPALGNWLLAYIKALEEHERFDILIESSLEHIENLFLAMGNQALLRRSYADVVFHVLSSLRESAEAFDRISSHIDSVLVNLASESSQWSRQLLQTLVDILTAMVDQIIVCSNIEDQEEFREKYSDVILCLERHISSRTSSFLPAWRADNISTMSLQLDNTVATTKIKVGLVNLGNTCYMNSVLQALFAARKFSIHVMMNLDGGAYWSDIGELFAKMLYSLSATVAPIEVYKAVKPPFFNTNHQHDSSEFLGYLFHLLRSCEHYSKTDTEKHNFNYLPAATRNVGHNANCVCVLYYDHSDKMSQAGSSDGGAQSLRGGTNMVVPECRVHSPGRWVQQATAGGPAVCFASGSSKRSAIEMESCPPKKRLRAGTHSALRRNTFVEDMFGGSLLTRVECRQCHSYSISRDVFCELQLSFPEKLMDKTHSIQSLLEYYCSVERMSGENRYQCRDCSGLRDADRSVRIDKSPIHLVLVLKNFEFDVKNKVNAKLMHNVSCNRNIVLPTVRSQKKGSYNLFAAVIHSGIYIDSGHYYTIAKDEDGWYRYDDSVVTIFDEQLLNNLGHACTPYILFYKRSDVEDVRLPALHELPQQLQDSVNTHNKLYKNQR